jgi:hypothetical protein
MLIKYVASPNEPSTGGISFNDESEIDIPKWSRWGLVAEAASQLYEADSMVMNAVLAYKYKHIAKYFIDRLRMRSYSKLPRDDVFGKGYSQYEGPVVTVPELIGDGTPDGGF